MASNLKVFFNQETRKYRHILQGLRNFLTIHKTAPVVFCFVDLGLTQNTSVTLTSSRASSLRGSFFRDLCVSPKIASFAN